MVYDNRFLPLLARRVERNCMHRSSAFGDGFIMTANNAFDKGEDKDEIGLFEMFGLYDEGAMRNAVMLLGFPDPFASSALMRFQNQEILWHMNGKIASEGIAFQIEHYCGRHVSFGASCFFMHLFSKNDFFLPRKTVMALELTPDDQMRLDQARRMMNQEVGLEAPTWSRSGFSDIDCYLRVGALHEYLCKFRRVDWGVRFGVIFPTGLVRDPFNPSSIPFGGNGFWGLYAAGDLELELKEDWKVGLFMRFNQRLEKRKFERIPVANEQQLYAAAQGRVSIDPGFTAIISPYARLECVRGGLGAQAQYTLIIHENDIWTDERISKTPPSTLNYVTKRSRWSAEYFTVDVFFDFSKIRDPYAYAPIISFKWDIPSKLLLAKRASKTNRISLGIEMDY